MIAQSATIDQIEAKISGARERLRTLDNEAKELSLPVVSGDEGAVALLMQVNASIRQVTADLAVLNSARLAAAQQQADAATAATAAYRARHVEIARGHAAEIVKLAARADDLVASYKGLLGELAEAERKIGTTLREAGELPNTAIVGRKDLARFMVERVVNSHSGRDKFLTEQRTITTIAAAAWSALLVQEGADNDDI